MHYSTYINGQIIQTENRETQALDDTFRLDRPNSYLQRVPSKSRKHTFFSRAQGTFSRIDHMLGHKASFGKFKKTDIVSSIFSDYNTVRLQINCKEKLQKTSQIREG